MQLQTPLFLHKRTPSPALVLSATEPGPVLSHSLKLTGGAAVLRFFSIRWERASKRLANTSQLMVTRGIAFILVWGLTSLLVGCAFDLTHVKQMPAQFHAAPASSASWTLTKDAKVRIGTGFPTLLKRGTRWEQIGAVGEGSVFRTNDQIVTVEASNIHEAQLVLRDRLLVGFYLPVEKTFCPVNPPQPLDLQQP